MAQEKVQSRPAKGLFQKKETKSIRPWHRRITVVPFGIAGLNIEPSQTRTGEVVVISFQATNSTNYVSIYPVVLKINDEVVAAEVVSLPRRTIMLMEFRLRPRASGKYYVEVNDSLSRFTVTGTGIENEIAQLAGVKPDLSALETDIDIRAGGRGKVEKPKGLAVNTVTAQSSSPADVIDKMGSGIEFALDKLGDAIIFSIEKAISPFAALFTLLKRCRD
jgi:hypothetical protein